MQSLQKRLRAISLALLITCTPILILSGCFGKNYLSKEVYVFNANAANNVEGKWEGVLESLLMWGLIIIPVYGIAWLVDIFILNLIDFWKGEKVEISMTTTTDDGRTIALETSEDDLDILVLTEKRDDTLLSETTFTRDNDGWTTITSDQGNVLGYVYYTPQETLQFYNHDKVIIDEILPSDIEKLQQLTHQKS